MNVIVFVFLENFPLSDLLAETSTGLEASMSNSTSCRYSDVYSQNTLLLVLRTHGSRTGFGQVQKCRRKRKQFCKTAYALTCRITNSAKQEVQHAVCAKAGREKELAVSCDNSYKLEVA